MTIPAIPTLIFALLSFLASSFIVLRIVIPFLPPHPLSSRLRPPSHTTPRKSLSLADRVHLGVTLLDLIAVACLTWQAILEWKSPHDKALQVANNPASAVRFWIALTARQYCLVIAAFLTLLNVRMCRTVSFGKMELFLWVPTLFLVVVTTAIAVTLSNAGVNTVSGLIATTGIITVASSTAFAGLLVTLRATKRKILDVAPQASQEQSIKEKGKCPNIDELRRRSSWLASTRSPPLHYAGNRSVSSWSYSTHRSNPAFPSSNKLSPSTPNRTTSAWLSSSPSDNNKDFYVPAADLVHQTSTPISHVPISSSQNTPLSPAKIPQATLENNTSRTQPPQGDEDSWLTSPCTSGVTLASWSFPSSKNRSSANQAPLGIPTPPEPRGAGQAQFLEVEPTPSLPIDTQAGEEIRNPSLHRPLQRVTELNDYLPDPEKGSGDLSLAPAIDGTGEKIGMRIIGLALTVWVPFVLSLPYLLDAAIPSLSTRSEVSAILLILSVTLFSPVLALNLLLSSGTLRIPPNFFSNLTHSPSPHPDNSLTNHPYRVSTPSIPPSDKVRPGTHCTPKSSSFLTLIEGRRSGDVWLDNGDATVGQNKLERILGMVKPTPKLSILTAFGSVDSNLNIDPTHGAASPLPRATLKARTHGLKHCPSRSLPDPSVLALHLATAALEGGVHSLSNLPTPKPKPARSRHSAPASVSTGTITSAKGRQRDSKSSLPSSPAANDSFKTMIMVAERRTLQRATSVRVIPTPVGESLASARGIHGVPGSIEKFNSIPKERRGNGLLRHSYSNSDSIASFNEYSSSTPAPSPGNPSRPSLPYTPTQFASSTLRTAPRLPPPARVSRESPHLASQCTPSFSSPLKSHSTPLSKRLSRTTKASEGCHRSSSMLAPSKAVFTSPQENSHGALPNFDWSMDPSESLNPKLTPRTRDNSIASGMTIQILEDLELPSRRHRIRARSLDISNSIRSTWDARGASTPRRLRSASAQKANSSMSFTLPSVELQNGSYATYPFEAGPSPALQSSRLGSLSPAHISRYTFNPGDDISNHQDADATSSTDVDIQYPLLPTLFASHELCISPYGAEEQPRIAYMQPKTASSSNIRESGNLFEAGGPQLTSTPVARRNVSSGSIGESRLPIFVTRNLKSQFNPRYSPSTPRPGRHYQAD